MPFINRSPLCSPLGTPRAVHGWPESVLNHVSYALVDLGWISNPVLTCVDCLVIMASGPLAAIASCLVAGSLIAEAHLMDLLSLGIDIPGVAVLHRSRLPN